MTIPVLLFHTGMHQNYHRSSDLAKFINTQGMREVTRMLFGVVSELATPARRRRRFVRPREETAETEKAILDQIEKPADRLGAGRIEDAAVSGGSWCRGVAGSAADRPDFAPAIASCGSTAGRFVATTISTASLAGRQPRLAYGEAFGQREAALAHGDVGRQSVAVGNDVAGGRCRAGAVILTYVVSGSSAAKAGLGPGDRIYQVGGRDFADEAAFVRLTKTRPESLPLLVKHDGRLRRVTLQSRQAEPLKRAA